MSFARRFAAGLLASSATTALCTQAKAGGFARPPLARFAEGADRRVEGLLVPVHEGGVEALLEDTASLVAFIRGTLAAVSSWGLRNYHLRLVNCRADDAGSSVLRAFELESETELAVERAGCYAFVAGDLLAERQAPRAAALEEMDVPISYTDGSGQSVTLPVCQRDILVAEGEFCRVYLDAQGRAMYVATMNRFVRHQSELSDAELAELWRLPLTLLSRHASGLVDARVNAGSNQNVAHLHLKFRARADEFDREWADHVGYQAICRARR